MTKLLIRLFIKNYKDVDNQKVRAKYGLLGGFVGIICNLLLFTIKLIGGIATSSIAIIADAFNNLSDAGSSIITILGFKLSNKPADKEHPFGHGRFEYLASLFVAVAIIVVGIELFRNSFDKIITPSSDLNFSSFSIIVLVISIVLKTWMSFFNRKVGKMISSLTMQATAIDSISDVIATSTVLVGLFISSIFSYNIDGYLGLVVALFIIYTGFKTVKETMDPILGQSPSPEFVKEIENEVLSHDAILGIHDLIVHDYGPGRRVISLHAEVDASGDILEMHDIIDNIERDIKRKYNSSITIHMDPIVVNDEKTNQLMGLIQNILQEIDDQIDMHDFRVVVGPTHTNIIFDIVVPFDFKYNQEEIQHLIEEKAQQYDPNYYIVIDDIDH
jgi:cation diffusion facilitator family transporter